MLILHDQTLRSLCFMPGGRDNEEALGWLGMWRTVRAVRDSGLAWPMHCVPSHPSCEQCFYHSGLALPRGWKGWPASPRHRGRSTPSHHLASPAFPTPAKRKRQLGGEMMSWRRQHRASTHNPSNTRDVTFARRVSDPLGPRGAFHRPQLHAAATLIPACPSHLRPPFRRGSLSFSVEYDGTAASLHVAIVCAGVPCTLFVVSGDVWPPWAGDSWGKLLGYNASTAARLPVLSPASQQLARQSLLPTFALYLSLYSPSTTMSTTLQGNVLVTAISE